MNYWLVKTEPDTYSWQDLLDRKQDHWDGVRNYQARNFLREMSIGDKALVYHSGKKKEVVGIAKVVKDAYPDPTIDDERWVAVDFEPVRELNRYISLEEIKSDDRLSGMILLKNSRLSVQPVRKEEYEIILSLSGE